MLSGLSLSATRWPSVSSRCGTIGVLLVGLTGCAGVGQLESLSDVRRYTVAIESVEGAPAATASRLTRGLEAAASTRQIAVAGPELADYRLRGYLAPQEGALTWVLDVYGADHRRAFRLSGVERAAAGSASASTFDDSTLQRAALSGVEQLAAFLAMPRPAPDLGAGAPPARRSSILGWPDDWAPESAGIFRLLRSGSARPELAADASPPLRPEEVRLPASRPTPSAPPDAAFAFNVED